MKRPDGFDDLGHDSFDAAAVWHARWRDAPDSGLTPQEVDQWADWSKVPENKAAYDAVEFVSRARFMLAAFRAGSPASS
jgi:hypothetical protein